MVPVCSTTTMLAFETRMINEFHSKWHDSISHVFVSNSSTRCISRLCLNDRDHAQVELELRRDYTSHYLCKQVCRFWSCSNHKDWSIQSSFRQIRSLMGEESLNDVNISFGWVPLSADKMRVGTLCETTNSHLSTFDHWFRQYPVDL